MSRNNSKNGRQHVSAKATNLPALPKRFAIGGTEVRPLQLYTVPERHPAGSGPWDGEPDKLAWQDAASGLDCILLRQPKGVWGAFVAVTAAHPLWGYACDAIPGSLELRTHGRIDYAEQCASYEPEEIRICHASPSQKHRPYVPLEADDRRGDAWWFGCAADKPGDYVPQGGKPILAREHGETYRDMDYMYQVAVDLAAQLAAIEAPPSDPGPDRIGTRHPKLGKA